MQTAFWTGFADLTEVKKKQREKVSRSRVAQPRDSYALFGVDFDDCDNLREHMYNFKLNLWSIERNSIDFFKFILTSASQNFSM